MHEVVFAGEGGSHHGRELIGSTRENGAAGKRIEAMTAAKMDE
jgi:hypothetical protein